MQPSSRCPLAIACAVQLLLLAGLASAQGDQAEQGALLEGFIDPLQANLFENDALPFDVRPGVQVYMQKWKGGLKLHNSTNFITTNIPLL